MSRERDESVENELGAEFSNTTTKATPPKKRKRKRKNKTRVSGRRGNCSVDDAAIGAMGGCCGDSDSNSSGRERVRYESGDTETTTYGGRRSRRSGAAKRSASVANTGSRRGRAETATRDDRSTRSDDDGELDIYVTDLASFLSSNRDPATVAEYEQRRRAELTRWSTRRQNLHRCETYELDEEYVAERSEDDGGFVTPPMTAPSPRGYHMWTPDVYESVNRSLNEFRKTYHRSETSSVDEDQTTAAFSKADDEYALTLPNMDIEDKAMYIDKLIVKSFRHLNNLTKVRFRQMLDDDVITTVMERYKEQYGDILFVTPCITKCVMVLQDRVANFLDPIKAKNYDLIFFVISDVQTTSDAHWSLLLLHRANKTFYHYDSLHGSHYNAAFDLMYKVWSYFKIKKGFQPECEQQPCGTDCGFYVIHNMLRCIRIAKEELYDEKGERITLKEPLKLPLSVDETKSVVIKAYVASVVDKIKKTAVTEKC